MTAPALFTRVVADGSISRAAVRRGDRPPSGTLAVLLEIATASSH